jgi:UDP-3-O-[3-hydroxymyristoyl] N-acetylglucosamine deacetylase/3-hydroxyacyl-[acyl-carrier-protein] dehydratase
MNMQMQRTIARTGTLTGRGLFTGQPATATFRAAPPDHGVVFVRGDLGGLRIPADIAHVEAQPRRTTLRNGDAVVAMCEHCMSALAALEIDNILIEIDGAEMPGVDGSAKPYVDVLTECGTESSDRPRRRMIVTEPAIAQVDGAMVVALPCDDPHLQIVFDLDYGPDAVIHRQVRTFDFSNGNYAEQIAPARTFVLESEARELRTAGMGKHLGPEEILVISRDGPLGGNRYRFDDELVRHKIVDLIGDLYLLGAPIQGRVMAYKASHALNHQLVRELSEQWRRQEQKGKAKAPNSVMDVRALSRILPHRYPMLLVDRVIEVEGDERITGIKNVTINEPFFQGHYPGTPIMPGVLIVEAMAQLSGLLIGQSLEHTGKLPVLMTLDRVRLRKPVVPGDQLMMEAVKVRVRSRIAQMKCRAHVGDELAAEAEIKFMLVDDEI